MPDTIHHRLMLAAINLAKDGYQVFPLTPLSKVPKQGFTQWARHATSEVPIIERWWMKAPYNIGIATGESNLLVIDLDVAKNGRQAGTKTMWELLIKHDIGYPNTRLVRTPSDGLHMYFRMPEGMSLGNTAGKLGAGIDTRGAGGYVVGPGSVTRAGAYRVLGHAPVIDLPEPLVELLTTEKVVEAVEPGMLKDLSRYGAAALRNELLLLSEAREGTRNHSLNRCAYRLGRLTGSGVLDRHDVETLLMVGGTRLGLPESECRTTINSGLNAGEMRPNPLTVVSSIA